MSDENLTQEKECNCICCKILKSDCFKKFLLTVLASFIGCSLAVILFVPKPPKMPCPRFMYKGPMMERQLPPPYMYHHKDFRGDFRRMHKAPIGEFNRRGPQERFNGDFKGRPLSERKDFGNVKPVKNVPLNENAEQ